MKAEVGKSYRTGRGAHRRVMGICAEHADWVWTNEGEWYRKRDGRWIDYNRQTGEHFARPEPSVWDLAEEVHDDGYWWEGSVVIDGRVQWPK